MINEDTIIKLSNLYSEDKTMLDLVYEQVDSFEEYHKAIYAMESKMKIYSFKAMEKEDYQEMVMSLDKQRTMRHNSVITSVNILNRLAQKEGLPLVYNGIVSEERPYRRELADAVLNYIEKVIKNRR